MRKVNYFDDALKFILGRYLSDKSIPHLRTAIKRKSQERYYKILKLVDLSSSNFYSMRMNDQVSTLTTSDLLYILRTFKIISTYADCLNYAYGEMRSMRGYAKLIKQFILSDSNNPKKYFSKKISNEDKKFLFTTRNTYNDLSSLEINLF